MAFPVDLVINYPDVLRAYGRVTIHWDEIEKSQYLIFAWLLKIPESVAHGLYWSQMSQRGRRDMITAILDAEECWVPEEQRKKLRKLLERVGKASSKRNAIAHGTWVDRFRGRAETPDLYRQPLYAKTNEVGFAPDEALSVADLNRIADELGQLRKDFEDLAFNELLLLKPGKSQSPPGG